MIAVWSCGGGLQSAAIAALICRGELPAPDYAVIADTGYEKSTTWTYLDAVLVPALADVGVRLERVAARDYATVGVFGGKDGTTALIPAFTTYANRIGKLSNFCSYEWKRRVIERFMRAIYGVSDYVSWIGFSRDEARRIPKVIPSKRAQRYVLIERGITRDQCPPLIARMGWPPAPRSACWMCPNQSDREWIETLSGPDRADLVAFDRAIRAIDPNLWLTKEAAPIEQAKFDSGQGDLLGCESGECFV